MNFYQHALHKILGKSIKPALNNLDQRLARYLNFKRGFFIEAGANDGYSQSNTYFLEKSLNWRGILIEGIPELYHLCLEERKRARVFHCALVGKGHHLSTVSMHYANLMSLVDGALKTRTVQENHLQAGLEIQELNRTYSVVVPARTLESILDKVPHLPKIDFFSLDVEGYELQVLKGLNLTKYRPTYILVEAKFFDEVNQFLTQHHYKMLEQMTHHDYFYIDALSEVSK